MPINDDIEQRYLDFLDRYEGNIRRFCIDVSENPADAREIMQEVFAAVWVGLSGLKGDCHARQANRWLYRVMVSVLVRHLRQRPLYVAMPPAALPDIADDEVDDDLLAELAAHLNKEDCAIVDELRRGYGASEIAEMHRLSVSAVYTRLHRIKDKLKTIYAKHYGK